MNSVKKLAILMAGLASIFGLTLVAAPTASAAPATVLSCPDNGWRTLDGRIGNFFNGTGINIRTGPGTECASRGQGQPNHRVRLDCWKTGSDGFTWSHLFDFTTSRDGWSRDDLLVGFGANVHC